MKCYKKTKNSLTRAQYALVTSFAVDFNKKKVYLT